MEPNERIGAQEVVELVRLFLRLKSATNVGLPDHLDELRVRLESLRPDGELKRSADYDLFFRIGLALQGEGEPPSMGMLSEQLGVPLSTATRMMDWMVDRGYARRIPDPQDRRVVRVELTSTGRELYGTITAYLRERIDGVFRGFTSRERRDLLALVGKLVRALEGER